MFYIESGVMKFVFGSTAAVPLSSCARRWRRSKSESEFSGCITGAVQAVSPRKPMVLVRVEVEPKPNLPCRITQLTTVQSTLGCYLRNLFAKFVKNTPAPTPENILYAL
jgi:hypothetical protein